MITIFTPTYNRAHLLPRLYDSIKKQTCRDFEWIIVDDGSKDNTLDVVQNFVKNAEFTIKYFSQENGGKHRAINRGVREANGELFFIVDADDWLPENAIELAREIYEPIKSDKSFGGICGLDMYENGRIVGSGLANEIIDSNSLGIRYSHNVTGDLKEIFRTDVLKEIPFPEFEGEKFCPEVLVWNRIALKYRLRFVNKGIYFCEYQPNGLTANIMKVRHYSPMASMTMYAELSKLSIPFRERLKGSINFWRFAPLRLYGQSVRLRMINLYSLIAWPVGVAMRINDKRHL